MDEVYIDIRKENKWIRKYFPKKDFVSIYELISCIEDLDDEIESWKEKYEDLQNDLEANYEPISYARQVCVYDSDFVKEAKF